MDPRNAELEAAIAADPLDREAYVVYADWLEGHGDPRAQLIRAQIADGNAAKPSKPVRKLLAEHRPYLLGPLSSFASTLTWRYGFVHSASLADRDGQCTTNVERLLAHPSARFLVELYVSSRYLPAVLELLAAAPPTLRTLSLSHDTDTDLDLAAIAPQLRRLKALHLYGRFTTGALAELPVLTLTLHRRAGPPMPLALALPRLRWLDLAGAYELTDVQLPAVESADLAIAELSAASARAIAAAHWPALTDLELDLLYAKARAADLGALFTRPLALTKLTIVRAAFADQLCDLLPDAPWTPKLRELLIVDSGLTGAGIAALAAGMDRFDTLEVLDVSGCDVDEEGFDTLDTMGVPELLGRYNASGE